jgi:Kef-type K+ transport system membrane component KefB
MIRSKVEAIAFGFLVLTLFVVSGIRFNLQILLPQTDAILRLVLILVLMLNVRGVPELFLYKRDLTPAKRVWEPARCRC